jgi:hypothetical protein
MIPHAIAARFDCNDKLQPCHEGTRQDVLHKIHKWIDQDDLLPGVGSVVPSADDLQTARIYWVNGPGSAGTGKTTIAFTIARELHLQKKLGASFFCSRDNAECRDPKLIFPTIAYQLGRFHAPFYEEVSAVFRADTDVVYSVVPVQLERLIVGPLHALKGTMPSCVIVIDALDECQDGGATSTILSSLAKYITQLKPLKFLITSRPEHHIHGGFELAELSQITQRFILHEIEQRVVETDIQKFLNTSLRATKEMYQLGEGWPAIQDVDALVHLSSGLFIFAATAAKFIQDSYYNDPQGQLARLLNAIDMEDSAPHKLLDQLYLEVLKNAFPDISAEFASQLRLVLGSIVHLQDPLSASDFEWLLKPNVPLQITLRHLHSVVIFPTNQHEAIHLIHPSFHEFLINPTRCINPKFLVNTNMQHSLLAQACLNAMKILKQNICEIRQPWKTHSEVEDLPRLVQQHISPAVQYACCHWASHLSQGLLADGLLSSLEEFCKTHLLHWVEVCSLLGELRKVLVALKAVHQLLLVSLYLFISCLGMF